MTARATKYFIVRRNGGSEPSTTTYPSASTSTSKSYTPPPKYEGPPRLCTSTQSYEKDSGARVAVQKLLNRDNLLKTKRGNFEMVSSAAWGTIIVPVEDPDALDISTQDVESAKLIENFPKVPADLWARWTSLCFYFCFGDKKEETKTERAATPQLPDRASETQNYNETSLPVRETKSETPVGVDSQFEAFRFTKLNNLFYKHGYKNKVWELIETFTPDQLASGAAGTPAGPGATASTTNSDSGAKGDVKASHGWGHDEIGYGGYAGYGSQTPELEVSCVLLRKVDDLSQWRILIPRQNVTKGSVNANFDQLRDIVTGELVTQFPPVGWAHAGSSHSHNTMSAFFSSTDDASELGVPGLHIVVGSLVKWDTSYKVKASLVLRHNRRILDINEVVDITPNEAVFHRDVLKMINTENNTAQNSAQINATPSVGSKSLPANTSSEGDKEPTGLDKLIDNFSKPKAESDVAKAIDKELEKWAEGGGL